MKKTSIIFSFSNILVLLAIIVFVNLISLYIFVRLDFTDGKIYSLSKASKKIIRNLPDRIIIKAFFTKNLPPDYAENRSYLEDLLTEYRTYSKGKIKVSFIDPSTDKDALNEARGMNIPPIRFQQIEKDKYEVKEGFMGVAFIYGTQRETIPVIQAKGSLEYDITTKIKKLMITQSKTIGLLQGHREEPLPEQITEFIMASKYSTMPVNLRERSINDEVSALFVVNPKEKFQENELAALEQFIMRGKSVVFLIDQYEVDQRSFMASKLNIGLDDLFAQYGVKIVSGLVFDWQCNRISIQSNQGGYQMQNIVEYPLFPIGEVTARENPIVKDRDAVPLMFTSPIEVTSRNDLNIEVLVKSSPKSWVDTGGYVSVNPFFRYTKKKDAKAGPFDLGVVVQSKPGQKYKNYFMVKSTNVASPLAESDKLGRIVIFGSSQFVSRDPELFLNILDWSVEDEDLIRIRSKGNKMRALATIPYGFRLIFKYFNIFVVPGAVVIYGFLRWKRRSRQKKNYINIYG